MDGHISPTGYFYLSGNPAVRVPMTSLKATAKEGEGSLTSAAIFPIC